MVERAKSPINLGRSTSSLNSNNAFSTTSMIPQLIPIKTLNQSDSNYISTSTSPTTPIQFHSHTSNETETLKHRLRLAKAEVASLQERLGNKPNPAPFGSSSPRHTDNKEFGSVTHNSIRSAVTDALLPKPSPPLSSSYSGRRSSEPSETREPSPIPTNGRNRTNSNGNAEASTSTSSSNNRASAVENPFFGSGASRERMKNSVASSASGSGKVIATLQADLMSARSALESSRQQLRLSQRAVEHLSRQNEDLKETKERISIENEGLTKTISRKERIQEDLVSRSKIAETSLATLQVEHRTAMTINKTRLKELETLSEEAEGKRVKAESEYQALRSGLQSLSTGFKVDLDWLRGDMSKKELKHQHDLEEARLKYIALTKVYKARENSHTDVTTSLSILQNSQKEFADTYRDSLASTLRSFDEQVAKKDVELGSVLEVQAELFRLRRLIQSQEAVEKKSAGK